MPCRLVRHGRVRGYRPTVGQLQQTLELAQGGIDDPDSSASLVYSRGNLEFYPEGKLNKILPKHLDQAIEAAGRPDRLDNLTFSIRQDDLSRSVDIQIGSDGWTFYRVESDDQTWAHGRYHERTENFLQHRGLYAKYTDPVPQTLEEEQEAHGKICLGNLLMTGGYRLLVLFLLFRFLSVELKAF